MTARSATSQLRVEVTEVDDAVGAQPAGVVAVPDDVVVGDVAVDGLDAQPPGNRSEPLARRRGDVGDVGPSSRVRDRGQQRAQDIVGVDEVPLHDTIETGMVEVGEGGARPTGQGAEVGDDGRCEVGDVRQRQPLDVGEQPQRQDVGAVGHLMDEGAVEPRHGDGCREPRRPVGDVQECRVLRGDRVPPPRAVGDLEDAAALVGVDQEVPVLVAAELAHRTPDAVDLPGELGGPGGVDAGTGGDLEGGGAGTTRESRSWAMSGPGR